jgi:hypothetical protein
LSVKRRRRAFYSYPHKACPQTALLAARLSATRLPVAKIIAAKLSATKVICSKDYRSKDYVQQRLSQRRISEAGHFSQTAFRGKAHFSRQGIVCFIYIVRGKRRVAARRV